MKFDKLKDRMEYYMNLGDLRLIPNSYVIVHIDGRSFSSFIKKSFQLPFDDEFIDIMNKTAQYVCENTQGCKIAYVQSDEINLIITDFDTINTESFFQYRITKLASVIGSMATARFNQLMFERLCDTPCSNEDLKQMINLERLSTFAVKVFNVPCYNDAFGWLKHRQNDCIRNSINQFAQAYCTPEELHGKDNEEKVTLVKEKCGLNWYNLTCDKKFGRILYKVNRTLYDENGNPFIRGKWKVCFAQMFSRQWFDMLGVVPLDREIVIE